MRGVVGLLPGGEMAPGIAAVCGRDLQVVIVVDVARRARNVGVAVGEQETGGAVIERGGRPSDGVVAGRTICSGKCGASGNVRRIVGLLPLS